MGARRAFGTAAAVLLLALSGCASPEASTIRPPIEITHPHAQLSCPDVPIEHLEVDPSEVEAVFHCTADFHPVEGVMNKVQYVNELRSDPAALLAAYTVADDVQGTVPCTKEYRDPLILWLRLQDGSFVAAYAPLDDCGKPQAGAAEAFERADFQEILVAREVGEE
jgi:hypothetical protein